MSVRIDFGDGSFPGWEPMRVKSGSDAVITIALLSARQHTPCRAPTRESTADGVLRKQSSDTSVEEKDERGERGGEGW